MDYKSLMGYGEKKKVVKKESKPKVNKVLQSVKKDLKEWNDKTFKDLPRRWGGASDKGLTEYEKQLKEVGAGAQYRKFYKDIERQQQGLSKSVEKFKKYYAPRYKRDRYGHTPSSTQRNMYYVTNRRVLEYVG